MDIDHDTPEFRAAAGDPEQLLAHARWVRGLAASLVFDGSQVDDVVQETWLAALTTRRPAVRDTRAWLGGILRNVIRRKSRGESRRRRRETAAARASSPFDEDRDLVAEAELQRQLVNAVLALEEPYRSTVLALDMAGHSAADVARREGLSSATVRSRHARALTRLRERLDGEHEGRRSWCLALLPLIGREHASAAVSASAAGATSSSSGTAASRLGDVIAATGKGVPLMTAKLTATLVVIGAATLIGVLGPWSQTGTTTGVEAPIVPVLSGADPHAASGPATLVTLSAAAEPLIAVTPETVPDLGRPITFSGRVVDVAGLPIPDASINLLPDGWTLVAHGFPLHARSMADRSRDTWVTLDTQPWNRFPSTHSDASGRFRLTASLVLWGERTWHQSGYRFPELVVRADDHATHFALFTAIEGNGISVGDVTLRPAARVSGRVIDDSGQPLPGVLVSLVPDALVDGGAEARGLLPQWGIVAGLRKALTDEEGRYAVAGLSPGSYALRFHERHHEVQSFEWPLDTAGAHELPDVQLSSGQRVHGVVHDPNGAPIENAEVFAFAHTWNDVPQGDAALSQVMCHLQHDRHPETGRPDPDGIDLRGTRTDAEGRFELSGLAGRTIGLYADATGHRPTLLPAARLDGTGATLTLRPSGSLHITLVDAVGTPLQASRIEALRVVEELHDGESEAMPVHPGASAAEWLIEDVDATPVLLLVHALDLAHHAVVLDGLVENGVSASRNVVIPARDVLVSGLVTDERGTPLAGVDVFASVALDGVMPVPYSRLPREHALTDADGHYALPAVPAGPLTMSAEQSGHYTDSEGRAAQSLGAGERKAVDLVLRRAGRLMGQVRNGDGEPQPWRSVTLGRTPDAIHGGSWGFYLQTDLSGTFTSGDLIPGHYTVEVDRAGWQEVDVVAGETIHLVLGPDTAPVAYGRVTAGGEPAVGVTVRAAYDAEGQHWVSSDHTITDADGRYTLALTRMLPITLTAETEQGAQGPGVDIAPPTLPRTRVDLQLGTRQLVGTLVASDTGDPVEGAHVHVFQGIPGRRVPKAMSDASGRFVFEHLEADAVDLHIRARGFARQRRDAVTDGEPLHLELDRGARLLCELVDGNGQPTDRGGIQAEEFRLVDSGWERVCLHVLVVQDGRVELPSLAAGAVMLLFLEQAPATRSDDPFDLSADALGHLHIHLPIGGSVTQEVVLGPH